MIRTLLFTAVVALALPLAGTANAESKGPAYDRLGMAAGYWPLPALEKWEGILGRKIPYWFIHYGWRACKIADYSAECMKEPWNTEPEMVANARNYFIGPKSLASRPDVQVVLIMPLAFTSPAEQKEHKCDARMARQRLQEVIDGKWDKWYRQVAEIAKDAGHANAVYRLGNEGDTCWPWLGFKGSNQDAYIKAYRHVWKVIKEVTPQAKFQTTGALWRSFKKNDSTGLSNAESLYPGKGKDGVAPPSHLGSDWVDYIGFDKYDDSKNFRGIEKQLNQAVAFAKKYGKPFALSEWGVYNKRTASVFTGNAPGRGDNQDFVTNMYNWLNTGPASQGVTLVYHSYFSHEPHTSSSLDNPDNQRTRARFIELFGS